MGRASVKTPVLYPAFFFVLGKAAKAQETQSYQRFQHIGRTAFNTSGTNGPRSLFRMKAGTHSPSPAGAHTAAHRAKQGAFRVGGAITTLGPFRTVRNLCARSGQKSILCHLCMDRGNVGEKQRAFGTETRTVRVSVPRRRGPAGLRCSTAVSCAAPVSFAVRYHCDEGQRGKFVNVTVVILFVV